MDPLASLGFFARIRKGLGILGVRGLRGGRLRCAVCGKRAGSLRGAGMNREPDSHPLCQSCFALMLQTAERKSLLAREPASGSPHDLDQHLA
jgi:hypothetical protein